MPAFKIWLTEEAHKVNEGHVHILSSEELMWKMDDRGNVKISRVKQAGCVLAFPAHSVLWVEYI